MKIISNRTSVLKKEGLLSVVILPGGDKKKLSLLFLWLLAWTVCGLIVAAYYFKLTSQNQKLFTLVYLSFWVYYEYKVARAFVWRKWGREKLWINGGKVNYQQEINGKGKVKSYDKELVPEFEVIEHSETNFSDFMNNSFWIKGGERILFTCQGKVVRLGMQLSDAEARELTKELNKFLQN